MSATATPPKQETPQVLARQAAKNRVRGIFASIEVSMPVLYYKHGDRSHAPMAGIVVEKGAETIRIAAFTPQGTVRPPLDGVRHIDDPDVSEHELRNNGVFELPRFVTAAILMAKKV